MAVLDDIRLALTGDAAATTRLTDTVNAGKNLVDTFRQFAGGTRSDAQPTPPPASTQALSSLSPSASLFGIGAGIVALLVVAVLALWRRG